MQRGGWVRRPHWQVFLSASHCIPRPKFDVSHPTRCTKQTSYSYLTTRGRKVFKCALTVVYVASRCKEAQPLPRKILMSCLGLSEDLQTWAPEMASIAAGRSWKIVRGRCLQRNGKKKTQNHHSAGAHLHLPRPRYF